MSFCIARKDVELPSSRISTLATSCTANLILDKQLIPVLYPAARRADRASACATP